MDQRGFNANGFVAQDVSFVRSPVSGVGTNRRRHVICVICETFKIQLRPEAKSDSIIRTLGIESERWVMVDDPTTDIETSMNKHISGHSNAEIVTRIMILEQRAEGYRVDRDRRDEVFNHLLSSTNEDEYVRKAVSEAIEKHNKGEFY